MFGLYIQTERYLKQVFFLHKNVVKTWHPLRVHIFTHVWHNLRELKTVNFLNLSVMRLYHDAWNVVRILLPVLNNLVLKGWLPYFFIINAYLVVKRTNSHFFNGKSLILYMISNFHNVKPTFLKNQEGLNLNGKMGWNVSNYNKNKTTTCHWIFPNNNSIPHPYLNTMHLAQLHVTGAYSGIQMFTYLERNLLG